MAEFSISCALFDPVRISRSVPARRFIIDTWFDQGLIAQELYDLLPGVQATRTSRVVLSSGMFVNRPLVELGVQIGNLRVSPLPLRVVDSGPAPLLLGSDFLQHVLAVGGEVDRTGISVSVENPEKRASDSLGLRLTSEAKTITAVEVERFLSAIRRIHNVGVIATSGLHQHADWRDREDQDRAVRRSVCQDDGLAGDSRLQLAWIESGSIWVTLRSGSKAALSWLTQLFSKSMDARLSALEAEALSAEEAAAVAQLTRDDIVRMKQWESRRSTAEHIRAARREWRDNVLEEIDFKRKLAEQIKDETVRSAALAELDRAIVDLGRTEFLPVVEHVPETAVAELDLLPAKSGSKRRNDSEEGSR